MLKDTKRETKPHSTVNLLLGTIKLILVSWLLSFSLNVSESPLPHQGAWDSAGYPHLHSRMYRICVPTSVPGRRTPADSVTADVLGQHLLQALVVGKEVIRPGLSELIWFSLLARSLKEPGSASTQKLPRCSAGPSHSPGRT